MIFMQQLVRDWHTDLKQSRTSFEKVVWPAIASRCGGGELIHLEGSTYKTDRDLDVLAGIDGYQRHTDKGLRGIASRVQPIRSPSAPWNTFTIRYARDSGSLTEYDKRLAAIENTEAGWLYAHLTVQAYIETETRALLSAAVVRTRDLFLHLKTCDFEDNPPRGSRCYIKRTGQRGLGGAVFVVAPWAHLKECGIRVGLVNGRGSHRPN